MDSQRPTTSVDAAPLFSIDLNNRYISEQIEILQRTINDSYNYLNTMIETILVKKSELFNEISQYMKSADNKYQQPNEKSSEIKQNGESESTMEDKNVKMLKNIIDVYSQIFDSIKSNFEILSKFLTISKNLEQEPLQSFYSKEFNQIINCCLFMKMHFEGFDVNKALEQSGLDDNFKDFIIKTISQNKSLLINREIPKMQVQDNNIPDGIKQEDFKSQENHISNAVDLKITNACELSNYLDDKSQNEKLSTLYIEKCEFGPNVLKKSPNLVSFTMKLCPNVDYGILEVLPNKIKHINLEKNNYINQDFQNIMHLFAENNSLLENLESLSFAGNNLTRVELSSVVPSKKSFKSLAKLNFKKNKIYKIYYDPEKFPNLKFINCCNNSLNKSYLKDIKKLGSLESGNGFLFEPELCEEYYNKLKEKLKVNENDLYLTDYLNITFMPKNFASQYFNDFAINDAITTQLRKLDLSYNGLDCNTFFKFAENNKNFESLTTLNLNGNEIDDTFFEKFINIDNFNNLEHLYLNSNKIGNPDINIEYKDNVPIDGKYSTEKDKLLVYKLRLIYSFIEKKSRLTKLTITKNPISEFYSIIPDKDADKSEKYIKRDNNNLIAINCLFSFLIKIRDELIPKDREKNGRETFNLRFDCRSNVNKNSDNYPFNEKPIVYKK